MQRPVIKLIGEWDQFRSGGGGGGGAEVSCPNIVSIACPKSSDLTIDSGCTFNTLSEKRNKIIRY